MNFAATILCYPPLAIPVSYNRREKARIRKKNNLQKPVKRLLFVVRPRVDPKLVAESLK